MPDSLPAYRLWCAVQTQWHWASDGLGARRVGLHYQCVRAAPAFVAVRGRRQREELFEDLCVMEFAWLAEDARQRAYRASRAQQPALLPA